MFVLVFTLLYIFLHLSLSISIQFISCFTEPFLVSVSSFSLSLDFSCCLVVWFLTFCLLSWMNLLLSIWTLFAPTWTFGHVPGLPLLSSPLDIVHRSKTRPVYLSTHLSCPQYTCLPCLCFWPYLLIKACMDPHTSHFVCLVTIRTNK